MFMSCPELQLNTLNNPPIKGSTIQSPFYNNCTFPSLADILRRRAGRREPQDKQHESRLRQGQVRPRPRLRQRHQE